ncbi:MAG: hypothetical protein ACOYJS_02225 [Acutalibacteraceae bacterium]|jgi:ABC-2 type transport system permease protein
MLKTLLKKQFLEINAFYFQSRKTGKHRSAVGTAAFVLLFAFVFLSIGTMFYGVSVTICEALISMQLDWLYFTIMGMLSIFLGVAGSVFNTYVALYRAKDNDLLLSMPIQPSKILFARMSGVYSLGLLFSSLAWIPAIIKYFIIKQPSATALIFSVLLLFLNALFVLVLTCLLGWVVAIVASRIKNKSFATVAMSIIFLAAYYFFYFRLNKILQSFLMNSDKVGLTIKTRIYPLYQLGLAATGEIVPMIIHTAIVVLLFLLCYYILSKSFIDIATRNRGEKKAVYKETIVKLQSLQSALLRRELKRFLASPAYLLNCGLGIIILPVLAVIAILKADLIRTFIDMMTSNLPLIKSSVPVAATAVVCYVLSTNLISAPSVSLEGKNIWIVQSLPVDPLDVLHAKQRLHILLNTLPALFASVVMGIIIGGDLVTIILMAAVSWSYIRFTANLGLVFGTLKANLTWTDETVPIKQSMSVLICLFGGWVICIAMVAGSYFLRNLLSHQVYFAAVLVLLEL